MFKSRVSISNEARDTVERLNQFLMYCTDNGKRDDVLAAIVRLKRNYVNILDDETDPAIHCPVCNGPTKRYGYSANGKIRYCCKDPECIKYQRPFIPNSNGRGWYRITDERHEQIKGLIRSGHAIREISRIAPAAKETVRHIYRSLIKVEGPFLCGCGKPSIHKGWCTARYARSERRQQYMQGRKEKVA
jgi:transposase-like protein